VVLCIELAFPLLYLCLHLYLYLLLYLRLHLYLHLYLYLPLTPNPAEGAGTTANGSAIRIQAYGNILLVLSQCIYIAKVTTIHSLSMNTLPRAAVTRGAAAAQRDRQKQAAPVVLKTNNYGERCAPFSMETYRCWASCQ
jgi:hypothetical protein